MVEPDLPFLPTVNSDQLTLIINEANRTVISALWRSATEVELPNGVAGIATYKGGYELTIPLGNGYSVKIPVAVNHVGPPLSEKSRSTFF